MLKFIECPKGSERLLSGSGADLEEINYQFMEMMMSLADKAVEEDYGKRLDELYAEIEGALPKDKKSLINELSNLQTERESETLISCMFYGEEFRKIGARIVELSKTRPPEKYLWKESERTKAPDTYNVTKLADRKQEEH